MAKDTHVALLRRTLDVSSYSRTELTRLAKLFHEERHPQGTTLCTEGELGTKAYLIVEGAVSIVRRGRRIATYGPGEFVGEMALLDNAPRSATVTAISPLRVLAVDRDGFPGVMSDPAVANEITSGLRRRARLRKRSITGGAPPSANPRAWSRLREAARQDRRRRRRRRLLVLTAASLALALLTGAGIRALANRSTPLGVEEVVTRYRDAGAVPAAARAMSKATPDDVPHAAAAVARAGADTPRSGSHVPDPDAASVMREAPPPSPMPAPGVYVYDTKGHEEVTIFGGSRHDYPARTTITITRTACGFDMRWDALEERWDTYRICLGGRGTALDTYSSYHEFYEIADARDFRCDGNTLFRPSGDEPKTVSLGHCDTRDGTVTVTTSVIGAEAVAVAGRSVPAVHLRHVQELTGPSRGTRTSDVWVASDTGLPLRWESTSEADAHTAAGRTQYTEQMSLRLTTLQPRS